MIVEPINDTFIDIQTLLVRVFFENDLGSLSSFEETLRINSSIITFIGNILSRLQNNYDFDDYYIYLQIRDQSENWKHPTSIVGYPREMFNPKWSSVALVVPYPECAGNTSRRLAALGVDTGIAQREFSINLFLLAKKITPSSGFTIRPGGLSRDINIYVVSPTGWQDNPITLQVPQSIEYREFLCLIHTHCLFNVRDIYWNSWCRQFQRIGHVISGNYLRVYLCLSSDILGYMAHAIAACFCIDPGRVGAVLPEILWWGPHRHVALRDWYPQLLQDKGWYLLVIPSIPDLIFPALSP
jgi:hypothetical protein